MGGGAGRSSLAPWGGRGPPLAEHLPDGALRRRGHRCGRALPQPACLLPRTRHSRSVSLSASMLLTRAPPVCTGSGGDERSVRRANVGRVCVGRVCVETSASSAGERTFAAALVPVVAIGINWKRATPLAANVAVISEFSIAHQVAEVPDFRAITNLATIVNNGGGVNENGGFVGALQSLFQFERAANIRRFSDELQGFYCL